MYLFIYSQLMPVTKPFKKTSLHSDVSELLFSQTQLVYKVYRLQLLQYLKKQDPQPSASTENVSTKTKKKERRKGIEIFYPSRE